MVWVLLRGYRTPRDEIHQAIHRLIEAKGVMTDRPAVEAGLALLHAGGDFADGVIAHEGGLLGGETFVSFDRAAVTLVGAQGQAVRLLV